MTDLTYLLKISIFWTKKKKKFFKNSLEEIFFFVFETKVRRKVPHLMTTEQSGGKEGRKFLPCGFLPAKLGDD